MNGRLPLDARLIVALCCVLIAARVFVFSAGFPLFNNVDERAHVDLVLKYSHGAVPRGVENYSAESARYFTFYSSPEYLLDPNKEDYGPPLWTMAAPQREQAVEAAMPMWLNRPNHESGEPPLYYALGGAWSNLGRTFGLNESAFLYWIRFLNVPLAIALVLLGYKSARVIFPDRPFIGIGAATLLTVWPQTSFYSIQADSMSAITFAIVFIGLAKLWQSERPNVLVAAWIGLATSATCFAKTANLPLVFVVMLAVIFKSVALARTRQLHRALSILAAFLICAAIPIGIWFAWNENHFGDPTATKLKIQLLDWTPKAFGDWWSHPIFTPTGARDFWAELMASFWRGEFTWHGERMATWWSDAFYGVFSTIALAFAAGSLVIRRRSERNAALLWLALLSFAVLVGFLVLLSIRYDFGHCPYPSRAHPFFTSGRLLNAAAVPIFLLFAYGIEQLAFWTQRKWVKWMALAVIAAAVCGWQLSINAPVFASQYNFFHRPTTE